MQVQSEYHGYYLTTCIKQHEYDTVYLGESRERTPFNVIVKIFNKQLISLRDRQRFLQEMNTLSSLHHPMLLPILEIGIDKGSPYLIREYVPAGSLITQLSQQNGKTFSLPTIMAILTQVGMAISYLHERQVVHGNIKPENILFNEYQQALLVDIRINSIFPDISSTTHKLVMTTQETRQYGVIQNDMQQNRQGIQDDVYAFSSIAYELLTGHQPFGSAPEQDRAPIPPSHWTPSLSNKVDRVLLRALSPQIEERFSSAIFFVEALQDALYTSTEKEDTAFVEKQPEQQITLQSRVAQQYPTLLQQQPDLQAAASPLSSARSQSSLPRALPARLPELASSPLRPTRRQLPSSRLLLARFPRLASMLSSARSQLPSSRSLLARLSWLASMLSSVRSQLPSSHSLLARLPWPAPSSSSTWSRLPPLHPLPATPPRPASSLSATRQKWPLSRSLSASSLSSNWSRLPSPHLLLAKLSGGSGRLSFLKLPLVFLTVLVVIIGILVPLSTSHIYSPSTTTHQAQGSVTHQAQDSVTHQAQGSVPAIRLTAMAASSPTRPVVISLKNRVPESTPTPHPVAQPAPAPAPAIINASFEAPALSSDFQFTPDAPGWGFSGDAGISRNDSDLTQGTDDAPAGVQVAFIQASGSMSQDVTFAGGTYRVFFLAAQRVNSSSTQSLSVRIDDSVVGTITPTGASYIYYATPSFTVSPGIHTLQFKGLRGGAHNTTFIDSVFIANG